MNDPAPRADARLETLACDIGLRPAGAPQLSDLADSVRAIHRDGDHVIVDYAPEVVPELVAMAAAERLCCAGIGWETEGATLRIRANPAQLDVLEQLVLLTTGGA